VTGQGDTSLLLPQEVAMPAEGLRIASLLTAAGLTPSNSEASRKLKEDAVRVQGEVVDDAQQVFAPDSRACCRSATQFRPHPAGTAAVNRARQKTFPFLICARIMRTANTGASKQRQAPTSSRRVDGEKACYNGRLAHGNVGLTESAEAGRSSLKVCAGTCAAPAGRMIVHLADV
jgi:hypothetical protein